MRASQAITNRVVEVFHSRLVKGDGCWIMNGKLDSRSRNRIYTPLGTMLAHRISYLMFHGEIPHGLEVCHSCDNPGCVNPNHLWLGTHTDNMRDMEQKGRGNQQKGERCGKAKLKEKQVIKIRSLYSSGFSYRKLAARFKMDASSIGDIVNRHTWSHI